MRDKLTQDKASSNYAAEYFVYRCGGKRESVPVKEPTTYYDEWRIIYINLGMYVCLQ